MTLMPNVNVMKTFLSLVSDQNKLVRYFEASFPRKPDIDMQDQTYTACITQKY
jgi:hypothetical protein